MALTLVMLAVFVLGTAAMVSRALPALLALPLMAIAMGLGACALDPAVSLDDVLVGIVSAGSVRLNEAMIVAIFGGILSHMMHSSGVAEALVKHGAELSGDSPIGVSVAVMSLVALLFTSVGGLGALIMVAMIVLPVLATVGVKPALAGGILLFGMSLGGLLNAGNWVVYVETMEIPTHEVRRFALALFGLVFAVGTAFCAISLKLDRVVRGWRAPLAWVGIAIGVAGLVAVWSTLGSDEAGAGRESEVSLGTWMLRGVLGLVLLAALLACARDAKQRTATPGVAPAWYGFLIPFVPLALILFFDVPILAAFVLGLAYAFVATLRPGARNEFVRSMFEGSSTVMPAVLLMVGIGMLVTAVLGPSGWSAAHGDATWPVLSAVTPLFTAFDLSTPLAYVLAFGVAAPLALYRGPLNVWGMGFGVAAVLTATVGLSGPAVMAMLLSVGQIQGICDPTNTHNVWLSNELSTEVLSLTRKTLVPAWVVATLGLILGAVWYVG